MGILGGRWCTVMGGTRWFPVCSGPGTSAPQTFPYQAQTVVSALEVSAVGVENRSHEEKRTASPCYCSWFTAGPLHVPACHCPPHPHLGIPPGRTLGCAVVQAHFLWKWDETVTARCCLGCGFQGPLEMLDDPLGTEQSPWNRRWLLVSKDWETGRVAAA